MDLGTIITGISGFILGGGLLSIITLRTNKRKADVEVKVDEINALHDTIEKVYEPIIRQQRDRIQELETEVKSLRDQLAEERRDRQREIDMMNKRILAITSALGLKANNQIRDDKGRYAKKEEPSA